MSFITDATLETALQAHLQKDGALESWWDDVLTRANAWAYWQIVSAFVRRGYTKSQIDTWDYGAECQTSLALFRALNQGATMAPDAYSRAGLEAYDLRKWLADADGDGAVLTASGAFVHPASTVNQVVVVPESTANDNFVPFDPDDGRIGEPSQL